MLMERANEYRALRAPADDGEKLVDPALSLLPEVATRNRIEMRAREYDVQGRSLADLSAAARRRLFLSALRYTRQYRGVPERWMDIRAAEGAPFSDEEFAAMLKLSRKGIGELIALQRSITGL